MTTAGSGDVIADKNETTWIVAAVLMIVGITFVGIITGAIAQRFIATGDTVTEGDVETHERQDVTHEKLDAIAARLDRLEATLDGRARRGP